MVPESLGSEKLIPSLSTRREEENLGNGKRSTRQEGESPGSGSLSLPQVEENRGSCGLRWMTG